MKLTTILILGVAVLSTLLVLVHSTFITTAAGAGFLGGFVMGKITLGMFLTAMNALNQRQVASPTGTVVTRDQSGLNIPDDVEVEVRDRFLRQLGTMDPLNCLPKVFCEVSSDPKSASEVFGPEAVKLLSQTSLFNSAIVNNADNKVKKPNSHQDDLGDDEDNSSQSDEDDHDDDEPMNEEEKKMDEYERKEKAALKSKGLDQLIDDYDDPLNYYFVLKEKKKPVSPELMSMIKDMDLDLSSRRSLVKKQSPLTSLLRRRIGTLSSDEAKNDKGAKTESVESSIDDVFENDPFFEEFTSSVRKPQVGGGSGGVVNVGLLRRNRRDTFSRKADDITMAKYKIAAEVAEMKDPTKCRKVFNTCPFSSEEVMNMITQLNSEDQNKTLSSPLDKKDSSLTNLKNTLFAIEKLNDATITAEALGEPVDYTKVVQDATQSNTQVSDGSTKILEKLDQIEEQFIVPESGEEIISKRKLKKGNKNKNKKKKQKQSIRIRRHNNEDNSRIRILSVETFNVRDHKNRKQPRERVSTIVRRQNGKLVLTGDRDDEFFAVDSEEAEPIVGGIRKYKFAEDSDSEEDEVSEEIKLPNIFMGKIKAQPKPKPQRTQNSPPNPKKKVEVLHSEQEDDEFSSPESEEKVVNVPSMTFSQTFIDQLGGVPNSNLRKPKPKPIHKVVQVKPQILRVTTAPTTSSSTTTRKPVRAKTSPLPKLQQKFSGESEDDEEDANNSEKEIDVLVSKYKPKDKLKP